MFSIATEDEKSDARIGYLKIGRKKIETPVFMPVATKGTVKFLDFQELEKTKTSCFISNSLLLYQRPGAKLISRVGGLHKFYGWKHGIFTDSGGFQSLDSFLNKKSNEQGIIFKSPYDGKKELISPEKAMEIQYSLGADVIMCLDDVPKPGDSYSNVKEKTERTHRWALRCKKRHQELLGKGSRNKGRNKRQLLFGIAQGGTYKRLRKLSAEFISKQGFDGVALGGLAIGEPVSKMFDMIRLSLSYVPKDKPRYLMGVGAPENIIDAIALGVDFFDSTFPTQNARHATLFSFKGKLRIDRKEHRDSLKDIDKECDCYVCRNYSRAYLHHLLRVNEATGKKLATYHNIYFMQRLIAKAKEAIRENSFEKLKKEISENYRH